MTVETISDAELADLVKNLPASPRLLAELAPKLQQLEIPLDEVTELLRRDAGLTSRLIAMANSAVYARAEPATSLEEAVACIGYSEVYRLVGAMAATQLADEPLANYALEPRRFRENALFVALVMEELAESNARTAYTLGLLRSIGKVALDRLARSRGGAARPLGDGEPLLNWERANWGCTNAAVAARILVAWRFPVEVVDAVREHYQPGPDSLATSHLLNISAGAADLRGFGFRGEEGYWQFSPENFSRTGVDEGRLVWAGERAFQALRRITSALG
jgi:HD-like signal output (HDOD) protein